MAQWTDKPLPDGYVEREITFASTTELSAWRKIIPHELPATHHQDIRYVEQPRGLPKLIIAPRPLPLEEVARRSNGFDLPLVSLRGLLEREGLSLPPPAEGIVRRDERSAMREALVRHLGKLRDGARRGAVAPALPGAAPRPLVPIPTKELLAMSDGDLETKATRLGILKAYTTARRKSKAAGVAALAEAMAEREIAEAAKRPQGGEPASADDDAAQAPSAPPAAA